MYQKMKTIPLFNCLNDSAFEVLKPQFTIPFSEAETFFTGDDFETLIMRYTHLDLIYYLDIVSNAQKLLKRWRDFVSLYGKAFEKMYTVNLLITDNDIIGNGTITKTTTRNEAGETNKDIDKSESDTENLSSTATAETETDITDTSINDTSGFDSTDFVNDSKQTTTTTNDSTGTNTTTTTSTNTKTADNSEKLTSNKDTSETEITVDNRMNMHDRILNINESAQMRTLKNSIIQMFCDYTLT